MYYEEEGRDQRACSIPLPPEGASLGELGLTPGGLAENGLAIAAHHDGLRVAEHCRSATQSHGRTLQSTQIVQDEVPIEDLGNLIRGTGTYMLKQPWHFTSYDFKANRNTIRFPERTKETKSPELSWRYEGAELP
ncbi:hypothetical protein B296_00014314 [Ensete ventricosum]|uniref:Uncharacterized protein n=1 Tax=Ensete ventricosum TaxID=4639 RepID=A0A427AY46_ENSVE|nr:hypothetical protein B296_00014314 [Ensete ventricosum]